MTCLSGLATVLLVAANAAIAQESWSETPALDNLRGLKKEVFVWVGPLYADICTKGIKGMGAVLDDTSIRTDVELKLRQAGFRVLTRAEWLATPGRPQLCISQTTNTHRDPQLRGLNVFAFTFMVELKQGIGLQRDPSMWIPELATTWRIEGSIFGCRDYLRTPRNKLRDEIKDLVDGFIGAYLLVNPKK